VAKAALINMDDDWLVVIVVFWNGATTANAVNSSRHTTIRLNLGYPGQLTDRVHVSLWLGASMMIIVI
jgi:hypothetical protein